MSGRECARADIRACALTSCTTHHVNVPSRARVHIFNCRGIVKTQLIVAAFVQCIRSVPVVVRAGGNDVSVINRSQFRASEAFYFQQKVLFSTAPQVL